MITRDIAKKDGTGERDSVEIRVIIMLFTTFNTYTVDNWEKIPFSGGYKQYSPV